MSLDTVLFRLLEDNADAICPEHPMRYVCGLAHVFRGSMRMKWFFYSLAAWVGIATADADANAYAQAQATAETVPKKTFTVERASGFNPVPVALEAFLVKQKAAIGPHSLCVIGYVEKRSAASPTTKIAWVHWREGNRLTLWEPAAKGFESKDTLIRSRRDLDLTKDIAESAEAVGSSTYLVSRNWFDAINKDCKKRGKTYLIELR
jgi:hypothetical protein